jgi:D-alanyl-D-alanine carboxypeptidase
MVAVLHQLPTISSVVCRTQIRQCPSGTFMTTYVCKKRLLQFLAAALLLSLSTEAQTDLSPELRSRIDAAAAEVLAKTGVPSASLALVQNGNITYVHAYGNARLSPSTAARPAMRYSIGSVSKQFTATAVLMLAEEGKLSLEDPVSRFFPDLTRANEVTIRELLSHTSGYQDYYPQDYLPRFMLQPTTAEQILDLWAKKPLDFEPGTEHQYSNTNYVIAGRIVEKAGGIPLLEFLQKRIFSPLKMDSVSDIDQKKLGNADAAGYMRYGLGPLRPAPPEATGWLFAMGELAMSVEDLAKWNIALINQSLLRPASYQEMETAVRLKNGDPTRYGLGLEISTQNGRRVLEHGGEVAGFSSENIVYPDHRVAITVLTNQDSALAAEQIAQKIAPLLLPPDATALARLKQVRAIFDGLQHGKFDRTLFTANANAYFSPTALRDFASSLGALGRPEEFTQVQSEHRGGMNVLIYRVTFPQRILDLWIYQMPDGRYEQYEVILRE